MARLKLLLISSAFVFCASNTFIPCQLLAKGCSGTASAAILDPMVYPRHEERFLQRLQSISRRLASQRFATIGLGDSIMQRWPEPLLEQWVGGPALNAGIGGDGVQQLLWRLDHTNWQDQDPRNIVLVVGTNDLVRGYSGCEILSGLIAISAKLKHIFPDAKINVVSILPRGTDLHEYENDIKSINDGLRDATHENAFSYVDAAQVLAKRCSATEPHVSCQYLQSPKNVHPTSEGYRMLVHALLEQTH